MLGLYSNKNIRIAKIHPMNSHYYLSKDRLTAGVFTLTTSKDRMKLTIDDTAIKIPPKENFMAIKIGTLETLNPEQDFRVNYNVWYAGHHIMIGENNLGSILSNELLRLGLPEALTLAFLSGGNPAIDLGMTLGIFKIQKLLPKFTDPQIMTKLNMAINHLFIDLLENPISSSSKFTLSAPEIQLRVEVTLNLDSDIRNQWKGELGIFSV